MIGKVITGKSFRGCIGYCLSEKKMRKGGLMEGFEKHRSEVLVRHLCSGDKKELSAQFEEVRRLNPRQGKPVLHITLSMAPGEQLGRGDLLSLAEACAGHMGFDKNQYLAVEHFDTKHQHLHIVANRVGYDGRVVSDSNSYKRMAEFCRKMEKEMGLKQVLSPRKFLPKHLRDLPRNDSRKKALKERLQRNLLTAATYPAFESAMKALGYRVEKGRGIAFIDEKGVRIKGSEVGYSLSKIERILRGRETRLLSGKKAETGAPTIPLQLQKNKGFSNIALTPPATNDVLEKLLKVGPENAEMPHGLFLQKKKKKTNRPRL